MSAPPSWLLPGLAAAVATGLPLYAGRFRGRSYALFAAALVLLSFPGGLALAAETRAWAGGGGTPWLEWFFVYGTFATGVHFASLVRARLRPAWFRLGLSVPGMAFLALGALAGPWLLALLPLRLLAEWVGAGGVERALALAALLPIPLVAFSIGTSLGLRRETVHVDLDDRRYPERTRLPVARHRGCPPVRPERPIRIVQIADPHLGPWQPVRRLRARVAELLRRDPDLVLITGDLLTMEGNATPGALAEALAPLGELPGRCFAVFGNHDHEAPEEVRRALRACGVRLLVDEEAVVATGVGPVQLLGADWRRSGHAEQLQGLAERFPRRPGHLRLWMLHDPAAFAAVPDGEADLVLSGHTHGGQVGLVSFGLDWTVLTRSRWPDHGLFALGANRLYVHRGTGFYGFPLRIGVPGEASLLELRRGACAGATVG